MSPPLITGDHGFLATVLAFDSRPTRANNLATRRFLLAARRPSWRMTLYEIVDGAAVPVAPLPSPRSGTACMLVDINQIIVTCTSRAPGDTTGPYEVYEHVIAVEGIWPIDVGVAGRLRNLATILRKQLPQLATPLASFES